jgi:hypothetical protein
MLKREINRVSESFYRKDVVFVDEKQPLTDRKAIRAEVVYTSKVTHHEKQYDANEASITRMGFYLQRANFAMNKAMESGSSASDAYTAAYTNVTVSWKLADNTVEDITIADLAEIHTLAVNALESTWV